ncbi:glycerol-3-phosphate 1-O-acyltransferase PlsY [Pontixanthobacter aestiaquae]|uniref:Glycerol-3-phosphate acyltransferase n=1 Tax=Pontixanthobacter aestiaquae TaxID=1509367 RepID=A0A844Z8S1_9SPHN|nr:glycerol-3-phosphate 1-O-acyltransferase PlsY [Pontixanthobacter aestiaquae]MDN3645650.1 glycerol-3-phosphate 1-O-acyltransferase PlsY [Pontixanthobacter aestiaquae]MXO83353.1 glycerol-3-phosphate 1-O-acyltransferase PlsY [Pontixanthobacter aestiaquae]
MNELCAALLGFALGSIPFGLILTKMAGLGDVREIGSGSIGATNVLRTGNKGLAAATVLLDAAKGAVPVLIAEHFLSGTGGIAAVAAVAGHCFTPWLKFKGGKGFATAAGVLLAMAWPVMLVCAAIWAATLAVSRISSVSSMTTVVAAPIAAWAMGYPEVIVPLIAVAIIVLIQHRANIGRLMRGEEPKVGSKS